MSSQQWGAAVRLLAKSRAKAIPEQERADPECGRRGVAVRPLALLAATAAVSAITLGFTAPQASAGCFATYSSQGDNVRGKGDDVGTRAYIQGSSTLSSCGFANAAVEIGNSNNLPTVTAGIQTGYMKQTSDNQLTDCGIGHIGVYTEWLPQGGIYECHIYATDPFGVGDKFTVHHDPTTGWMTFFDGDPELSSPITNLGFGSGFSWARGEVAWTSSHPTFFVNYGPSGLSPGWEYETNSNGCCTSYTPVPSYANGTISRTADSEDADNDWNVGSSSADPPSPFYIQWLG